MSLFIRDMMTPINEQKNFIKTPNNNDTESKTEGNVDTVPENSSDCIVGSLSQSQTQSHFESQSQTPVPSAMGASTNVKSTSSSSTTLNMPSPPLSPYTRNGYDDNDTIPALLFPRASKPLTSDLRVLESYSQYQAPASAPAPSSVYESSVPLELKTGNTTGAAVGMALASPCELNSESCYHSENSNPENSHSRSRCETSNSSTTPATSSDEESILHIDPYKNLNMPGFKKISLNFLSEYQFKNFTTSYPYSSYSNSNSNSVAKQSSKSATRQTYETVKASTPSYNSDSDMEKRRTRRLVRQNNLELETVEDSESVISRPSTPVTKKRAPSSNTVSPSAPKRQRTATPVVYNYDYKKIENFCPLLDTLPPGNKCLRTDWKGQSMDLSTDPLINELHPAEVVLASILRLPCAVYLDSKRRIFYEKVKRMRSNLPFRRTDAQKSCKIDVNKASRLYASFEKVGWFDEKHFQKYM